MRPVSRNVTSSFRRLHYAPCRFSSSQPPSPRPFKPTPPEDRISRHPVEPKTSPSPSPSPSPEQTNNGILFWLWPFKRRKEHLQNKPGEPPDMARAELASQRYVREGVVDEKYRDAGKHVTRLICALPIVIGIGVLLFQRRFQGAEQKKFPKVKTQRELR